MQGMSMGIPGLSEGLNFVSSIYNTMGNIANAQNSDSASFEKAWSTGSSAQSSIYDMYSNADAYQDSWANSNSIAEVLGTEATARDIINAAVANQLNIDLWRMQSKENAKQAEIARKFQERMSNTSYQRAVADLKRAGLNPILAAGNMGATTPVGAMATSGLQTAAKANTYANSYSYSNSSSGSHSESHQRSGAHGSSSGYSTNQSQSKGTSRSQTRTQGRELLEGLSKIFGATSAMQK